MTEGRLQSPVFDGSLALVVAAKWTRKCRPAAGRCDPVPLQAVGKVASFVNAEGHRAADPRNHRLSSIFQRVSGVAEECRYRCSEFLPVGTCFPRFR